MEHGTSLLQRAERRRFIRQERMTCRDQAWHLCAPSPGIKPSIHDADRYRRCGWLARAPGS